jgi:hypothetical protein
MGELVATFEHHCNISPAPVVYIPNAFLSSPTDIEFFCPSIIVYGQKSIPAPWREAVVTQILKSGRD